MEQTDINVCPIRESVTTPTAHVSERSRASLLAPEVHQRKPITARSRFLESFRLSDNFSTPAILQETAERTSNEMVRFVFRPKPEL